jgi:precorrin-4/cobalt-precorrin-4 C11-methyltransferase
VPGDFSTFCPFQSFAAQFGERARVIPGVGAHSAASAILKRTFDLPGVAHATVVTSPRAYRGGGSERLGDFAGEGRTLVLYMNDLPLPELVTELRRGYAEETPIGIFERIGCPDAQVTLATLATVVQAVGERDPFGIGSDSPEPALALVIVGAAIGADEAPQWWDHRYEKIWKPRGMR